MQTHRHLGVTDAIENYRYGEYYLDLINKHIQNIYKQIMGYEITPKEIMAMINLLIDYLLSNGDIAPVASATMVTLADVRFT